MYFIWYIIIGIIAGFVAGKLMRGGGFGLFINLLVGIVYGSLKTSLCKKENADYVSQTTIVCEFADSERVLFRQLVADNDSGHGLFKDTRTEKMLVDTLHCDEIVADQINEEMHKYIMGQAFLVNEGYTEFDQARLAMETERVFEFVKKIFVK